MYQLNSSQLFLTYAQCSLTKERALALLSDKFMDHDVLEYVVAEEKHANGDPHLHCYFKLGKAWRTRDPLSLDIAGFHGNYQGCRSAKNVMKYCTKEENYVANIDVAALLHKTSSREVIAKKLIFEGKSLTQVVQEHPALLFGYSKFKLDLQEFQADVEAETAPAFPEYLPNPWGKTLASFRANKIRHWWIYSDGPNYGKTTGFAIPLVKKFGATIQAGDSMYWNVSKNLKCLILDDYNSARFSWNTLNQLCDNTFSFRVFMKGCIVPENKYVVIILSNRSIVDLYPRTDENQYLYARFEEVKL